MGTMGPRSHQMRTGDPSGPARRGRCSTQQHEPTQEDPPHMPANPGLGDRSPFPLIAILVSLASFLFATICVVVVSSNSTSAGTTAVAAPIAVNLSEFKISPSAMQAAAGDVTMTITNSGTMVHNVSVSPGGGHSADISPGKTATLDLGQLAAG